MEYRMPEREKVVKSSRRKIFLAVRDLGQLSLEVARKYGEDGGPVIAAAISFFALLSVIPLILLGVWALGHFLSSREAFERVVDYLEGYLPGSSSLVEPYLQALVKGQRTIGWLAVGGLTWSASQGFVILELGMNLALRVRARRSFIASRLLGLGMILLAGGSLLLSLLITSTLTAIQTYPLPLVGWQPGQIPVIWSIIGEIVSTALTILSFFIIYRVLPNTHVPWRSALTAGAIAGLAWEIAKRGFTYYLPSTATAMKQVYGSIAGVIALVVWIYYSSVILVLGAELVSVLQNVHSHHLASEPGPPAPGPRRRGPRGRRR
jgi:membrane protein